MSTVPSHFPGKRPGEDWALPPQWAAAILCCAAVRLSGHRSVEPRLGWGAPSYRSQRHRVEVCKIKQQHVPVKWLYLETRGCMYY